ncbi:MAG: SUMF1/EgtB/PvdO family nonheme iron enzyme [Deltaproteobacteria bacterium]|nr:SUMF1/EgtB/PvdO family nonheme iron enzyme [Deltaproteobacteria bacterium]
MITLLWALACAPSIPGVKIGPADTQPPSDSPTEGQGGDSDPQDSDPDDSDAPAGPCPAEMALIGEALCVDRVEASLETLVDGVWTPRTPYGPLDGETTRAVAKPGRVPQGYISGDEAEAACGAVNKRLCTSEEWLLVCQGDEGRVYPYGDTYDLMACNDTYGGGHPVVDYFGTSDGVWDTTHMNDAGINQQADSLAASGDFPACVTPEGVLDLHGNLHEWVNDADGTFRGGFYADAKINGTGCEYRTTAHSRDYHDYSTGFRCCADATN